MERGVRRAAKNSAVTFSSVPLADGGEGTLDALLLSTEGWERRARVRGPLGQPREARWGILPDGTALIEMAEASGLTLVDSAQRDVLAASTFGTGQLIKVALDAGCRAFLIGVGGSATSDGGSGALTALGAMLRDEHDVILPPGGGDLRRARALDLRFLDARLAKCHFTVLCDVSNPLCGPQGAAHIYGPQKGASPQQVAQLDTGLSCWADVVAQTTGSDLRDAPGAGAAGGTSFGLMSVLGAQLAPGIERVLDAARFDETLAEADWVLTGEGCLDAQTLAGKTVAGVCRSAGRAKQGVGVPVLAFGGAVRLSGAEMDTLGLRSAFALCDRPLSLDECIIQAGVLLEASAERAWRCIM